jgi:hypothetical protein
VKEISLINTALIVDLKIDLNSLSKDKNNEKVTENNINDIVGGDVPIENINSGVEGINKVVKDNVDTQLQKEESEKVDEILNTVVKPGVDISNADLNGDIYGLVIATNKAAQDPQLRAEYLTYLKQEQEQKSTSIGGSKLKKNIHHKYKKTKNLKKHKNKTSKSKNIKKRKN